MSEHTTTEQQNVIRVAARAYTRPGGCVTSVRAYVHVNCDCRIASTLVGTYDNVADAEKQAAEEASHGIPVRRCTKSQPIREQATAEIELADTVAAVEQAEAAEGTWRGAWLTVDEDGQQLTLDGTRPDAQQGCLFA